MEAILRGLNTAQRAAVTSPASVLQVLAPPGSGKTTTLTSRVAYLLAHHGYGPSNVICCTFTIKASREMRERLQKIIGGDLASRLILGTFHSICRRYLVRYGYLIDIPKGFGIADSDDSLNIIKRAVKRLKLGIEPRNARSRISHRKSRGEKIEDFSKTLPKTPDSQDFLTIFREYEDTLAASNLLDYDDLLIRCVELLRRYPNCVQNVEAVLIDEFQDTSIVQFELMKHLASAQKRITIVGDPDQSIYAFRSAEVENLERMKVFYPDTLVINLEENYRSASAVLRLAQQVIEQDEARPEKKLKSTHRYGTLPVLRKLHDPYEEARWIVNEIRRIEAMTGNMVQHDDIAILIRSAYLSLNVEKALASAGMPYKMVAGRRFFDRVEIRILLDYLRTISHPDNTSAMLAIINTPKRKVGDTTVNELSRLAEENKESLWAIVQKVLSGRLSLNKNLSKAAEQGLQNITALVTRAHKMMETMVPIETPGKLIQHVINELNYRDFLKKEYPEDHEERWENVGELLNQASDSTFQFNVSDDDLPEVEGVDQATTNGAHEVLARFLANVVLSTEVETAEGEEQQRVTISTIHAAKGLEWPVVFIPAVYEGSIPHSRAEDTNEERRLLYVAMTRAQGLLYMTFPVMHQRSESECILTQFLPSEINPMVSRLGPRFDDSVVADLASILGRPMPSQEDLTKGLESLRDDESPEDDKWPVDGRHKPNYAENSPSKPSLFMSMGRPLAEEINGDGFPGQRSHYSTWAPTRLTSLQNVAHSIADNLSTTFTTANHMHQTCPQAEHQNKVKPSLAKSVSDPSATGPHKARLTKTLSGQGDITSFFSQHTSRFKQESAASISNRLQLQIQARCVGSERGNLSESEYRHTSVSIPVELASHRPVSTVNILARPRIILGDTKENISDTVATKRDHHTAILDSSSRDENDGKSRNNNCDDDRNSMKRRKDAEHQFITSPQASTATSTSTSRPASTLHHTTMSQLHGHSSSLSSQTSRMFSSSTVNTCTTTTTMTMTTTTTQNTPSGAHPHPHPRPRPRTLGVRRSMGDGGGWNNRKRK